MHTPYVRKTEENRRNCRVEEDGFRLLRWMTPDDNLRRFRRYVEQAVKRDRRTGTGRCFAMKMRRLHQASR